MGFSSWATWRGYDEKIEVEHREYAPGRASKKRSKLDLITTLFGIPTSGKVREAKQWPRIVVSQKSTSTIPPPGARHRDNRREASSKPGRKSVSSRDTKTEVRIELPDPQVESTISLDDEFEDMPESEIEPSSGITVEFVRTRKKFSRPSLKDNKVMCLKHVKHDSAERKGSKVYGAVESEETTSRRKDHRRSRRVVPRIVISPRRSAIRGLVYGSSKANKAPRKARGVDKADNEWTVESYGSQSFDEIVQPRSGDKTQSSTIQQSDNPTTLDPPPYVDSHNPSRVPGATVVAHRYIESLPIFLAPPAQVFLPSLVPVISHQQNINPQIVFGNRQQTTRIREGTLPTQGGAAKVADNSYEEHLEKLKAHYEKQREPLDLDDGSRARRNERLADRHHSTSVRSCRATHGSPSRRVSPRKRRMSPRKDYSSRREEIPTALHSCAICAKPRSQRYHEERPVRLGKTPSLSICRHCRKLAGQDDRPAAVRRAWDRLRETPDMRFWCARCGTVRSAAYHQDYSADGLQPVMNLCSRCTAKKTEDVVFDHKDVSHHRPKVCSGPLPLRQPLKIGRSPTDFFKQSSYSGFQGREKKDSNEVVDGRDAHRRHPQRVLTSLPEQRQRGGSRSVQNHVSDSAVMEPPRPKASLCRTSHTSSATDNSFVTLTPKDDPFVSTPESGIFVSDTSASAARSLESMQTTARIKKPRGARVKNMITPVSPIVHTTVPKSLAERTYQSPAVESVADSDVHARGISGIHPTLQPLLVPLHPLSRSKKLSKRTTGSPGKKAELHAVTTDSKVPLPPIPHELNAAGQSPQPPSTVKSAKSAKSFDSSKTRGSTACSSGCQSCGCNGACRKTPSSTQSAPRSCLRARGATTSSSSQKTVQWSESQSYITAPEYDRTPIMPTPEEQLRRWEQMARSHQPTAVPRPLTPEEVARRFSGAYDPRPPQFQKRPPYPQDRSSSNPPSSSSKTATETSSSTPLSSSPFPRSETPHRSTSGPAGYGTSFSGRTSRPQTSGPSTRASPYPFDSFTDAPYGAGFRFASSFDENQRRAEAEERLCRAGAEARSRAGSRAGMAQPPPPPPDVPRTTHRQPAASGMPSPEDFVNYSYPNPPQSPPNFSYPAASPRSRRGSTGPAPAPSARPAPPRGHRRSTAVGTPDAQVWEVDSDEAAEIESTRRVP